MFVVAAVCALAQSPVERAVTLARERRYAEAREALRGAAEPAEPRARIAFHRLKAAVASGLGEAGAAAEEMRAALSFAPNDAGLLLATAVAEAEAGRLDDGLKHASAAGGSAAAQEIIGEIQEKRGKYVEAAQAYQEAVRLAPQVEQYRIALALELVEHHTFGAAIVVLQQAAPLFPKSARIRTLLGIAQYAEGQLAEGIGSLMEAIGIDPSLEQAYAYLGKMALELPTAPAAKVVAAVCGRDAVMCAALKLRAARANDDGALMKEAIAGLQRAPADSATGRCELGRAYEWAERWQQARKEMEACVKLEPSPQNHYRLGRIYGALGLGELARKEMELRNQTAEQLNDEMARKAGAVQAFQYVVK